MKISLGTDHAGFRYKEKVKELLRQLGHEVVDFGTNSENRWIIPYLFGRRRKRWLRENAIAGLCSGDLEMAKRWLQIKLRGVRCALCWNEETARLSRQHNDANVLSMGQRVIPEETALAIVPFG
jgi:ribose 5-phosphate isomerase B